MSWYAIDAVSDGIDETKALLFPFDRRRWLTLAVMVFFLGGGGGNVPTTGFRTGGTAPGAPSGFPSVSHDLVIAAILVVVFVLLALLLLGSVLEFVFVDALRTRDVRIFGRFGARLGKGVRLFGFQLALFLVVLAGIAALVLPLVFVSMGGSPALLALWVIAIPVALFVFFLVALVQLYTTSFVVPVICERGGSVLGTWRAFWSDFVAEWQQFALFAVVKFGLGLAAGVALGVGMTLVALPVFVLLGAGLLAGEVSVVLIAAAVVLAVALYLVVLVAVQTPVTVFIKYHALCTLDASEVAWTLRESAAGSVEESGE